MWEYFSIATDTIGCPSLFLPSRAVIVVLLTRNWKKGTSGSYLFLYFLKGNFSSTFKVPAKASAANEFTRKFAA